jgi:sigma-B regulation protein RsbU (phosphoserine phosphatase)
MTPMFPRQVRLLIMVFLILFGIVSIVEIMRGLRRVRMVMHPDQVAGIPFRVAMPESTIETMRPEAETAGLHKGDQVLEIEGRPLLSYADIPFALSDNKPGDMLPVKVLRGGQPVTVDIKLAPRVAGEASTLELVVVLMLACVVPWSCMLLGFLVVALRPRDMLAWLVLAMMLSFAQIVGGDLSQEIVAGWKPETRATALFYHSFLAASWPIWMMLFSQYFPDRISPTRLQKSFRWFLGVPVLLSCFVLGLSNAIASINQHWIAQYDEPLGTLARTTYWVSMAGMFVYFSNLGYKKATYPTPDGRRRLKLIYWGSMIGLTPIFCLLIAAAVMRVPLPSMPRYLFIPALLLLAIFPATMVYVIVVQRALDLKVVLRQGVQYALATRGVRIAQAMITLGILLFFITEVSGTPLRTPQKLQLAAFAVLAIVMLQNGAAWLQGWVDRHFFRDALQAEESLSKLTEKVRTIVEKETLLTTVTESIADSLNVSHVAAMVAEAGHFVPVHAAGFGETPPVTFSPKSAVIERLRAGNQALRVYFDDPKSWVNSDRAVGTERSLLEQLDAQLLLPLSVKDKLLGFLALGPKKNEEPYSRGDVRMLESVAAQTGLALENTRLTQAVVNEAAQRERLHRELEIASEVQQKLFPQSVPEVAGVEYWGYCRPALSVGGDYYDYFLTATKELGLAVGDVSGKGIPSALLMASLQAALRGMTLADSHDLAALMSNLNKLIFASSPSNKYATFFYGQYDPATRKLVYVNGGHNSPMVFRGGEVFTLDEGGPPVGLFGPARYQQAECQLQAGDVVVMFTDGISECMNAAEDQFGEDRIAEVVRACRDLGSKEMIARLMSACDTFAAGAPQHDDMTVVVAKFS